MIALHITGFQGIKPRVSPRLLADMVAQIAANCTLTSGEIAPLAQPKLAATNGLTGTPVLKAIYRADGIWFMWSRDVDVARSPLPGTPKFIYSGDGEPRITTEAAQLAGARSLGIPKPASTPTVTPSGGALTDVDRYYAYTFYDDWNQESGVSPLSARTTGKPDGTWAVAAMDTAPVSSGNDRAYFSTDTLVVSLTGAAGAITGATNAGPIVITQVAHGRATGARVSIRDVGGNTAANNTYANPFWVITVLTVDTYSLDGSTGNAAYTAATGTATLVAPHWLRAGDETVLSATTLATSAVPTPYTFKVAGDYSAATTWARKTPWGASFTKRLYRTSGTKAQFQLVVANLAAATVSYADAILDKNILGDELISASWELPPTDLKGLMTLPSGALCGFSGNELCFSEPLQPHAWPPEYRMRTTYPVVAVQQFSSGVVAGTTGTPAVILGHEPGQMSAQPVEGANPCLSKRSMVSLGDSVAFATAHGMLRIGDSGVSLLTQDWFTRDEWVKYAPATMLAETVRGRLYVMTQGVTPLLLMFDFLDQTGLTVAYTDCTELFADTITGKLYISDSSNKDIREYDPVDGIYLQQDWMSKEFVVPKPINLGAARVNFASRYSEAQVAALLAAYQAIVDANSALLATGNIGGLVADDSDSVCELEVAGSLLTDAVPPDTENPGATFTLYVDGVALYTKTVTNAKGFPLPSGYKSDTFAVRVQGQSLVKAIDLAETLAGLNQA